MDGKPLFRVLRQLGNDLPHKFALFPPLVLDRISAGWALRGGHDLLAHYTPMSHGRSEVSTSCPYSVVRMLSSILTPPNPLS